MSDRIALLGSTGSIGTQVLDVVARFPDRFRIASLAAGDNLELLAHQIRRFRPDRVCIKSSNRITELQVLAPGFKGEILAGAEGLNALAEDASVNCLVVGLVGMIGLEPTLKALQLGKRVLTANKETFVAGGHLVAPYLEQVIPIDSEHSAIHQCLHGEPSERIRTLYLTASGGPFRTLPLEQFPHITVQQALRHPNWEMGRKITIDSATMMNKGLEVIEAHWLFQVPYRHIEVVIHPQSIVHSGVEFVDGSVLAQMGTPDMHGPIQYAMTYPERLPGAPEAERLNFAALSRLDFEPPDLERFPCIRLAYEAGLLGSSATTILNAADEVAVSLFLEERVPFLQIYDLIAAALEAGQQTFPNPAPDLAEIFRIDQWARNFVLNRAAGGYFVSPGASAGPAYSSAG